MNRVSVLLFAAIMLGCANHSAPSAEQRAAARVNELGGEVIRDETGAVIWLNFGGCTLSHDDIRVILAFPRLQTLKLQGATVDDQDMGVVGSAKSVVKLDLSNTKVTDAGLARLAGLSNLRALRMAHYGQTVSTMGEFKNMSADELAFRIAQEQIELKSGPGLSGLQAAIPKLGFEGR